MTSRYSFVHVCTGGSAMSNLDALVNLRPQPDVDGPGFYSDGDMLQVRKHGVAPLLVANLFEVYHV